MLQECKNCHLGLVNGVKTCEVCGGRGAVEVETINGTPMVGLDEKEFEAKIDEALEGDGLIVEDSPNIVFKKDYTMDLKTGKKHWYKFW